MFRPKAGAKEIAEWAQNRISEVQRYIFDPHLDNIRYNYCSKFVWQAFWYAGVGDIIERNLSPSKRTWIYPSHVKRSKHLDQVTTIDLSSS
ncbi:hypothetical protein [Terrihalobacillus insolitus]|uniref:hypothetical protein n=1 Tax=Terrihalobacillus insolitus TaxID=2950438 RepID=UPI00233F91BB|nr:hypothetical protein [Terrihalobacillus insolitus]MDC3414818.1 hypothetical protein [Terrihalobacillus insolitus]